MVSHTDDHPDGFKILYVQLVNKKPTAGPTTAALLPLLSAVSGAPT